MRRIAVLSLVPVLFLFVLPIVSAQHVWAQATLENPQPGSFQSGVGVISGWACNAQTIEISFNGGPRLQAGAGTLRADTQGVCGDTDNGFGLLYNWNLLGDGPHTVTAYADGVEFASVTVTVTTLGTEFLRGASGAFTVSDFPATGATRTLRWQEAQQNFVITAGNSQGGGASGAAPHILENPQPGSFQSGVGVISGWACDAQTIEISFDGGPRLQAGAGTLRADTQGVCGDTDNGFGLLYNWNLLGDGPHTVTAYADGEEFASVTVTVTTLGEEFRRGLRREVTLSNFPAAGTNVVLRWQEAQQNFVITQTTSTPVSAHFLPDANLRRAVEEALDKPPGATITKAELATLRGLAASDYGIIDLTGLEFATNLTWLALSFNEIVDLTPLAGLVNLTWLNLWSNEIVDLTPLAGLVNLTTLYLSYTTITDLTPLAGLVNLETLDMAWTGVRDLVPLFSLTKLTSLDIDGAPVRQEDIDTLAATGVAVDGSPLPAAVGDIEIHHDNVIVMHLPELPVTEEAFNPRVYTLRIYEEFEDVFDYLIFYLNFDNKPEDIPYIGGFLSVGNDTRGIGMPLFFNSSFGSRGQLLGVLQFPQIGGGPLRHELMHTWANFVVSTSVGAHWGFSSANGELGGFPLRDLVHLGGNRYKVRSHFGLVGGLGYSPIELYLAGLIPPDEVPDLWVAEDGEWLIEDGKQVLSDDGRPIFTATKVRTITIDDIIAEHGERVPDWTKSQKDFRAAMVLLVDDDHPATLALIQDMSEFVSMFSHPGNDDVSYPNYYEATGGRGSITMDGLSEFLKDEPSTSADMPVSYGELPPPALCPIDSEAARQAHSRFDHHQTHLHNHPPNIHTATPRPKTETNQYPLAGTQRRVH